MNVIIDTGCANLSSLKFAIERLNKKVLISADKSLIEQAAAEDPAMVTEINDRTARALEKIQSANGKVQEVKEDVEAKVSEMGTKAEQVADNMGEVDSNTESLRSMLR